MSNPKPNFNTDNFLEYFTYYSQLSVYSTILRISDKHDRFIHSRKSRETLCTILGFSGIRIREILRDLTVNKVLVKGKRGVYFYNKELLQ